MRSDGLSGTAGWSGSRRPPAPAAASMATAAHARRAALARWRFRTAAAVYHQAAAAPPKVLRGDQGRWSETHPHPQAISARAWAYRCRGRNLATYIKGGVAALGRCARPILRP